MARVEITCTKEWKQQLKVMAAKKDMSVTAYIKDAVFEKMKKDNRK